MPICPVCKYDYTSGETECIDCGVQLIDELPNGPEMDLEAVEKVYGGKSRIVDKYRDDVQLHVKYEGYIKRQQEQVDRFRKFESIALPQDIDYSSLSGLSNEVVEKLTRVQPRNLGQASRISGITPAAVSILQVYLRKSGLL